MGIYTLLHSVKTSGAHVTLSLKRNAPDDNRRQLLKTSTQLTKFSEHSKPSQKSHLFTLSEQSVHKALDGFALNTLQ